MKVSSLFFLFFFPCILFGQDVYHLQKIQSNVHFNLLSVSLSEDGYGCISGNSDTLLITQDGGKTWNSKRPIISDTLISKIDQLTVLDSLSSFALVFGVDNRVKIIFSNDKWLTYKEIKTPTGIRDFKVKNKDTLYYIDHTGQNFTSTLWLSSDQGTTWVKKKILSSVSIASRLWLNNDKIITLTHEPDLHGSKSLYTELNEKSMEVIDQAHGSSGNYWLTHILNGRLLSFKNIFGISEDCQISPVFLPNGSQYELPLDTIGKNVYYITPNNSPYGDNILLIKKIVKPNVYEFGYMETAKDGESWNIIPIDKISSETLSTMFDIYNYNQKTVLKVKQGIIIVGKGGTILGTSISTKLDEDYDNKKRTMDLKISPHPVQNSLNFNIIIHKAHIYNSLGEQVQTVNYMTTSIDVSDLVVGLYYVTALTEYGIITKSFVKF